MKKLLIISATSRNNLIIAKKIETIITNNEMRKVNLLVLKKMIKSIRPKANVAKAILSPLMYVTKPAELK